MAADVSIRPATDLDAIFVGSFLRAGDLLEAKASGYGAIEAARLSLGASLESWAGCVDGRPVAIFGLAAGVLALGTVRPWLWGTDALPFHAAAFLRRNRPMVAAWLEQWPLLENWVDARNTASIRWLRWLGFRIFAPEPFGPYGLPFRRFEMRPPGAVTFAQELLRDTREEALPLLRRHRYEIAGDKTVPLDPDWDAYEAMERAGALLITVAREGSRIVGYFSQTVSRNLHYRSMLQATADIFWLAPEYRKGLLGLRLIKAAERAAIAAGATHLIQNFKIDHDLTPLFVRLGYTPIETYLMKKVA